MKRFVFLGIFAIAIAIAAACSKTAPLAEYKKMEKDSDVPRISVQDAKKEVDAGTAVIVDARGDAAYKAEHIAGSLNIALGNPDTQFSTLPKDKKIIVYCS